MRPPRDRHPDRLFDAWGTRLSRVVLLHLVLMMYSIGADAQLSPGPLSTSHQMLEGVTKCFECHALGAKSVDQRCLACHGEIAWLTERRRGLHGSQGATRCATCHPEHGGEDLTLIDWGEDSIDHFDHARTGWALDGRHASTRCADCHRDSRFLISPAIVLAPEASGTVGRDSWIGLEPECFSCHGDVHDGRLGAQCASCHNTQDFHDIAAGAFDHEQTRYPLRGSHQQVACSRCHSPDKTVGLRPSFRRCSDCHGDPHGGDLILAGQEADCGACHDLNGFRPSTFTVDQHRSVAYPLEGKHLGIACGECHRRSPLGGSGDSAGAGSPEGVNADSPDGAGNGAVVSGGVRVEIRPVHGQCSDCHRDEHGEQLALTVRQACEDCHAVQGWRPSIFTVQDHSKTAFALTGRHEQAECGACHKVDRLPEPARSAVERGSLGDAGVEFHPGTTCTTCHSDPHTGLFSEGGERPYASGCLACHDTRAFRPSRVGLALHEESRFALEGAHRAIPCFECHRELNSGESSATLLLSGGDALTFQIRDRSCGGCHDDPHHAQFADRPGGVDCAACHGAHGFSPADRFDHERDSGFVLSETHVKVACARCHPSVRQDDSTWIRYRPLGQRCVDCHAPGEKIHDEQEENQEANPLDEENATDVRPTHEGRG